MYNVGIIWVYFTLAGVLWWLVIALNLFLLMLSGLGEGRWQRILKQWYHVYHAVWALPLLPLIIALANEKLGYSGDLWCSIHTGPSSVRYVQTQNGAEAIYDSDEYLWGLLLLIVPILVVVATGFLLLIAALIFLVANARTLGASYLLAQWRLLLFLAVQVYVYLILFAFEIQLIVQKDQQYRDFVQYIDCKFSALFNAELVCSTHSYVAYPLWFVVAFNATAQGVAVFLIFGTSPSLYKAWLRLFQLHRLLPKALAPTAEAGTSSGGSTPGTSIEMGAATAMTADDDPAASAEQDEESSDSTSTRTEDD